MACTCLGGALLSAAVELMADIAKDANALSASRALLARGMKSQADERGESTAASGDDDMVDQGQPRRRPAFCDHTCQRDVLHARRRIATRVVVDQEEAARADTEKRAQHVPRAEGDAVRSAARELNLREKGI